VKARCLPYPPASAQWHMAHVLYERRTITGP
jgi:hypothetical protein